MGHLTDNKPKCLVPIKNKPMIFHLFDKFPQKKFIVIGDYQCDVLKRYLKAFAKVDYVVVNANGKKGTCGGIRSALTHVPEGEPFLLIWSDLVLEDDVSSLEADKNYIGISKTFPCRWKYENGQFQEENSTCQGVAGLFVFSDKSFLSEVPEEGEFVHWLSQRNLTFEEIALTQTNEYGLLSIYSGLETERCRPFNQMEIHDDYIIKRGIDEQGRQLAELEQGWYKKVQELHLESVPKIYDLNPLKMEKINGKNVYEYKDLGDEEKKKILESLINCLQKLHGRGRIPADKESFEIAYISKTKQRLEKVRDLVPFADDRFVTINGKRCHNIFYVWDEVEKQLNEYMPEWFEFLHGDCTFSNIMLRLDGGPVLIDPRGYFGKIKYFGDPAYDWAKLYYSVVGNYDRFNLKKFRLHIDASEVHLEIESNGWEKLEPYFFSLLDGKVHKKQIKLIHAIIWLSLTTYAWQDYDSICGAFYNGLYLLEEVL